MVKPHPLTGERISKKRDFPVNAGHRLDRASHIDIKLQGEATGNATGRSRKRGRKGVGNLKDTLTPIF
jgi:hypothetical protein